MIEDRDRLIAIARLSHDLIVDCQDAHGAYPASPTFSAYRGYSWLRDGAFTAEGVSRFGDVESANAFHDWVTARLADRRSQVDRLVAQRGEGVIPTVAEMLPTRFPTEDHAEPDTWWNFQTDGYGTWLWSVVTHAERHAEPLERWRAGIEVAADYASAFWDLPCYDWWEENVDQRHGSTLGALFGGLSAVARSTAIDQPRVAAAAAAAERIRQLILTEGLADDGARLAKWLGGDACDASLASCIVPFAIIAVEDPVAGATIDAISENLDVSGGVHRYLADEFYGGGQWPLLSCLLGWNQAVRGDVDGALAHLRWSADQLSPEGQFPEQVPHHLLHPEHRDRWVGEWGPVATPLLWSHGMYLILADELGLLGE